MNAHVPIDFTDTNMTSKGQVLIPKSLRDRAGLTPTHTVQVGVNEAGDVVVRAKDHEGTPEQLSARFRAGLASVRGSLKTGFASTDEYMDVIRPHRREDW